MSQGGVLRSHVQGDKAGERGLYNEVQYVMGNGHMGTPVDRLTDRHDSSLVNGNGYILSPLLHFDRITSSGQEFTPERLVSNCSSVDFKI